MNPVLAAGVISALVGSGGGIVAILLFPWARKKLIADTGAQESSAAQEVSAAAVTLVAPLRIEIQELRDSLAIARAEADGLRADLRAAHDENARLRAQLA